RCPGKSASSPGTNISSQIPPSSLATGETTFNDLNQRIPSPVANTGSRKAPTPKNCRRRSEPNAPTIPIQFRATREPVNTEALFSDGSRGEYDANARKRRRAETHKRNPSSSFSRRLFVGLKMRAMNFIRHGLCGVETLLRERTGHHTPKPEPDNYYKRNAERQ